MRKLIGALVATALFVVPGTATAQSDGTDQSRVGMFVGARFKMTFGKRRDMQPTASLAIAGTQMRATRGGALEQRISDGIALTFTPDRKTAITLAGAPVGTILSSRKGDKDGPTDKQQLSRGRWIGIGFLTAIVVAGIGVALVYDAAKDNTE